MQLPKPDMFQPNVTPEDQLNVAYRLRNMDIAFSPYVKGTQIQNMIKLFTIGFTGKPAEKFFSLLRNAGVKNLVDTRINNVSQLSGFAKGMDLKFFAKEIANISYEHNVDLAPRRNSWKNTGKRRLTGRRMRSNISICWT